MKYEIQEITSAQYEKILNSGNDCGWNSSCEPHGLFFMRDGRIYIGVDNSTGECWTEEFSSLSSCKRWLLHDEFTVEMAESGTEWKRLLITKAIVSSKVVIRFSLLLDRWSKRLDEFIEGYS